MVDLSFDEIVHMLIICFLSPKGQNGGQICPRPEARCRAIRGQNRNQGTNQGTKWEPPKPVSMGFGDKFLVLSPFSSIIKGVREKIRVAYICQNGDKTGLFVPEAHGCWLLRASPFVPLGTASGVPLPLRTSQSPMPCGFQASVPCGVRPGTKWECGDKSEGTEWGHGDKTRPLGPIRMY